MGELQSDGRGCPKFGSGADRWGPLPVRLACSQIRVRLSPARTIGWLAFMVIGFWLPGGGTEAWSQTARQVPPTALASEDFPESAAPRSSMEDADPAAVTSPPLEPGEFNLLRLMFKGGPLMIPILLMSVLVVTLAIERSFSLRQRKVLPRRLVAELGKLAESPQGFDPRGAYRICQRHPSAAATVIRAMLLKVGRPQSEVEHAVAEVSEREASRLYGNVRWLNLAAAVTPLMGLFGTVWGMIRAFFDTTQLQAGQNKADFLAEGIYVALVTTLGGLAVAIPAAILSHYFEGRIQSLFFQIDELLFNLLPQVERFEGRLRVSQRSLTETSEVPPPSPAHTGGPHAPARTP
jgi:biopolymer transport protein ExbB